MAANILAYCGLPADSAWRLAIRFSTEVLRKIPHEGGQLSSATVMAWLDANLDMARPARALPVRCVRRHRPIVTSLDMPRRTPLR